MTMGRPRKNKSENGETMRNAGDRPSLQSSSKTVLFLIRQINETHTRVQSENGAIGAEIKEAVKNRHLHSGALKLIAKLVRMDELKRLAFLSAFDLYRTYADEAHWFGEEHVGDLMGYAKASTSDLEAEQLGDVVEDYVRKPRRGTKP